MFYNIYLFNKLYIYDYLLLKNKSNIFVCNKLMKIWKELLIPNLLSFYKNPFIYYLNKGYNKIFYDKIINYVYIVINNWLIVIYFLMGNQSSTKGEKKEENKGDNSNTGGKMRNERTRRNSAHITGMVLSYLLYLILLFLSSFF